ASMSCGCRQRRVSWRLSDIARPMSMASRFSIAKRDQPTRRNCFCCTASRANMFRDLLPLLADRFLMVAPDLPGFGQSDMPPRDKFKYTSDNIAGVIDRFIEVIGFDRFAVAGTQAPGFFRLKVGSYEVTVLSDGGLALDASLFAGDEAGKEKCLKDAHLPTTGIPTSVNAWLVNTGSKLVLVDTGGGKGFAPTLGRLPQNLVAA